MLLVPPVLPLSPPWHGACVNQRRVAPASDLTRGGSNEAQTIYSTAWHGVGGYDRRLTGAGRLSSMEASLSAAVDRTKGSALIERSPLFVLSELQSTCSHYRSP